MPDYVTVADVDQYAADFGAAWSGTTEEKQAAIRRAQAYLDGLSWLGHRTGGRSQTTAWPRTGVVDADGVEVDAEEIPHEIETAAAILAVVELANPGGLSPEITPAQIAQSETVGPISVTYRAGSGALDARPIVTGAMDAIRGLLRPKTIFLQRA